MPINLRKTKLHYNDKYYFTCMQKFLKEGYSINQACKLMNISRQKYYNVRQRLEVSNAHVKKKQTGGGSVVQSSTMSSSSSPVINDELNTENMEDIRKRVSQMLQPRIL